MLMIPIFAQIVIAVPYNIGFGIIVEPLSVEFWVDVAIDVYFLFDVFLNFRTAYYCDRNFHLSGSGLVTDRCKIATHYAKTWLIIDIVSCAPIAYVVLLIQYRDTGSVFSESPQASTVSQSNRQAKLVKILRLLRLVKNMAKVAKLKKLKQVLAAYEDCLGALTTSVTILKLLLVLLLLGHAMVHAHATMCTNHCHAYNTCICMLRVLQRFVLPMHMQKTCLIFVWRNRAGMHLVCCRKYGQRTGRPHSCLRLGHAATVGPQRRRKGSVYHFILDFPLGCNRRLRRDQRRENLRGGTAFGVRGVF